MYNYSKKFLSIIVSLTLVGSNLMPAIAYAANENVQQESSNVVVSDKAVQEDMINEVKQNDTQEVSSNIDNEQEQTKWDQNAKVTIKQELKRYLKYENKTLVSFLISSGVKDNTIPLIDKTIQVYVPKIQDKEPSKIIVSGKEYTYQDQILIINNKYNDKSLAASTNESNDNNTNKVEENTSNENNTTNNSTENENNNTAENTNNSNNNVSEDANNSKEEHDSKKLNWESNDEVLVTFIYESQMEDTTLKSLAIVSAKTIDDRDIEAKTEETSFNVSEQIGNLLETSITGNKEVNKGYLYTNLSKAENKLETKFNTNYQINIGFKDLVDEIQIKESNLSDEILTRKIAVNKKDLVNVLGEEGTIKVLDSQNQEIGTLKQDNLELNINSFGLKFITSKPTSEGYISLNLEKVFNTNTNYTLKTIENKNEIDGSIDVTGVLQGNEVSNNHIENKITLVEPSSNASISINKNVLSTVVTNENVVITATLEKNDITDLLYKNPELLITLPNQITGVKLKDARLIYENELVPVTFETKENNIYLRLEGTQTEYSELPNVNGTVVKIVADLTLDNLAVNADEKIVLQYTNRIKDEVKSVDTPIKIAAPAGFVTSNYGTVNETVSCISKDESLFIKANDVEKRASFGGIAVSNLKENTKGLMILGRFPKQDTKSVDGNNTDLNSTYSININTPVSVEGIDADIYYSENGGATYDLANEQNGWSLEKKDTSKSYLIVAKSEVAPAQKITFTYNGAIPQNIDYENRAYSIFGIYYNDEEIEGTSKNIVSSKLLSIETENIPIVKTEITATDYNVGDEIKNGDKIPNGKYVQYIVRATNTGRKAAENVTITAQRPEDSEFFHIEKIENEEVDDSYFIFDETLTNNIDKIEPGQTVEFTYIVRFLSEVDKTVTFRTSLKAENMLEDSTASFENTITEGIFEMEIYSEQSNEYVKIGDEINYNLSLESYSAEDFKNMNVNINIPKYIDILKCEGGNFNKETRVLSYNIESLESFKSFEFTAKVISSDEPSQKISLVAKATYEGSDKEVKSNTYTRTVQDLKGFSASFSSNISYKMLDSDKVEYYVDVKNESKETAEISVFNRLPDELQLVSYTVKNGDNTYTEENDLLNTTVYENVEPYKNLKVTIVAKPYLLDSIGQIKEIENEVEVKVNDIDFPTEKIKQQIEGSSNFNIVNKDGNLVEKENIYSISGEVWYDENNNSAHDENDTKMSSIMLKLYDINKKDYVKDKDGNDIIEFSNDNGEYKFEDLYSGKYIVIADYDNKVYKVVNYQAGETAENENNDFIENTNIENSEIEKAENFGKAATNIITLGEENVYNIDLGLIDTENFNITVNNKISKITLVDGEKSETYDYNDYIANLKVNNAKIENSTLIIEYCVEVKNEGNIDGYVTQIANKLQDGMEFVSELNQDWYVNDNNEAINSSLSNKLIKSGESETLKLVLIKNKNNKNGEVITNSSEIRGTYNQYGIEEVTTSELEKHQAESAQIYLSTSSDSNAAKLIVISVSIIIAIALVTFYVKKILERKIKI